MGFVYDRFAGKSIYAMTYNLQAMKKYILAMTTCPESTSKNLARILVERRVCACVNTIPHVESIYHWKHEVVTDIESILIMKTESQFVDALRETVLEHHPYEVPEFIVLNLESGSKAYLDWISMSILEH
jgi:periplasmic divalent cation tolerance protein